SMPPHMVDVNVHPTKLEVRFQDGSRLYSVLLGSLRKKFLSTDMTARVGNAAENTSDAVGGASEPSQPSAHDTARAEQHRRELTEWARGQVTSPTAPADSLQKQIAYRFGPGSSNLPPFRPFEDSRPTFLPSTPAQAESAVDDGDSAIANESEKLPI